MPSLRKKFSSYFRQLSFHNETREKRHNINENSFVTKYLEGQITLKEGPPIIYGKNPTDLPNYEIGEYDSGPSTVIGCYSGPNGGLTTVRRTEKHLSILDNEIDFIDTYEEDTKAEQTENGSMVPSMDDSRLPNEWNRKSDYIYGISDSLYDRNQVTRMKNGDPIADCFGIIARKDSAILAVADGVNWGEKASIAAKSAIHGSLHYLNKTIFNDTKPFENLTIKTDASSVSSDNLSDSSPNVITNTREIFICLLRAFNCAHDLILENEGMLTTLTVAVVLPLKQKLERKYRTETGDEKRSAETQYVCCVCNVGDTLAYIYSQKYGVRELTKGSHDINCNRDMRDALGALGPVDGINPELSNLTISITTLQKGDIVMVATDGLTDNFDPNVSKFTVNTSETVKPKTTGTTRSPQKRLGNGQPLIPENRVPVQKVEAQKPPVKPPRRSKNREISGGNSFDRGSVKSNSLSEKSSSPSVENVQSDLYSDLVKKLDGLDEPKEGNQSEERDDDDGRKTQDTPSKEINDEARDVVESSSDKVPVDMENPLVAQFMMENSLSETTKTNKAATKKPTVVDNKASSLRREVSSHNREETSKASHKLNTERPKNSSRTISIKDNNIANQSNTGYRFLRSRTTIDMRSNTSKLILRNDDGVPYVSPMQRYELQLLLMEDILKNGISGKDSPCTSAKKLCENLISYTISITSAKRRTLEDPDLYYDNRNGVLVEVSALEKRVRRKKGLEKVQNLPGKLDHVTVVAYNVGSYAY